ncbi:MAG TPA: hypothetical protein VMW49_05370 [Candidatus Dormibacteraeota bacterium]|nr:hypothetical protein [Candidatus Dormibacteraeota bacterium]
MKIVTPAPLPTPAAAEQLAATLWSLGRRARLSVYLLGTGTHAVLTGVHSPNPVTEQLAASAIAGHDRTAIQGGESIPALVATMREQACRGLAPHARTIERSPRTGGWPPIDTLYATHERLVHLEPGQIAGIVLAMRPLPAMRCRASLSAFASGPDAATTVVEVTASYGIVGVAPCTPQWTRRAVRRAVAGQIRRPVFTLHAEEIAVYWHPPYTADARRADAPPLRFRPPAGPPSA